MVINGGNMEKKIIFTFSGQGSQYLNMARELYLEQSVFRNWMNKCENIVSSLIGESLLDKIYSEKKINDKNFDRTLFTHPAIFCVEYSLAMVFLENGIVPDCVLGSSLGEFVSATVAGVMNIEETLECVTKQAEILETYCQRGGMLAIIDDPEIFYQVPQIYENSELVGVNYKSHFVISGDNEKLDLISGILKKRDILCQLLPISHAFHSSLIDSAELPYKNFLNKKTLKSPKISFASSVYGNMLEKIQNDYFWDIVRKPIKFNDSVQRLESEGEYIYIDLGPFGTHANFIKHNLHKGSRSEVYSIITPFNQDMKNLSKVMAMLKLGNPT